MDTTLHHLKRYALYLLGRRAYTSREMRDKLMQKIQLAQKIRKDDVGTMQVLVDAVIDYLENLKLLDDRSFASQFVQSLERRGKSKKTIEQKLTQKGISKDTIEAVLAEHPDADAASLQKAADAFLRRNPDALASLAGKAKLTRHLAYRGFQFDAIRKIITEMDKKK